MTLLESYNKNKKKHLVNDDNKHLLTEVSVASGVGGFVGAAGDYIDLKFAGPFKPDEMELEKLLNQQVEDDIEKRMYTDDITPELEQDFIDLEFEYEYTPTLDIDVSKFKSKSDTQMQLVDIEINYDKIIDKTEENKKFINDTNDWKFIYDNNKK